ncbi:MAG: HAMP domain-containing sensor histidine kinase [Opitutaceae bacterium]|nr:HAMP domain-containing sensor histidine kinase [Opitutaceae bacterium]
MSATSHPNSGRFAHFGVLALTVFVFGGVVLAVTLGLRADLREQILQREAATLGAIASNHIDNSAADHAGLPPAEVPGVLLVAVLKSSRLPGVVGVRVFDADRKLNASFPYTWSEAPPSARDWAQVAAGRVVARLHPRMAREEIDGLPSVDKPRGLVEAWVPLRHGVAPDLLGAAHFWIEADAASSELGAHDRRLLVQAVLAWVAGSAVIGLALMAALRRLRAANAQLRARRDDLERANRELVLAAKTSALGAVAAHLMHEIKNPLAGLESIMAGQREAAAHPENGGELAAASALTRRLRTMVNDIAAVLHDEQTGAKFDLTCPEIAEIAAAKVRAEADSRGVTLEVAAQGNAPIAGRRANLVTLVLRNLLQNALEAAPRAGRVKLTALAGTGGGAEFFVDDDGVGLPAAVRERLFQPCASSKPGGSGLGLAISQRLAQQAGGRLELVRSDETGSTFRLVLDHEA